jgi:hypothetical protein
VGFKWYKKYVNIGGQQFTDDVLTKIKKAIREEPAISRLALSRRTCELLNWRSPNGQLKEMSCRKALVKLHNAGVIDLPKPQKQYEFEHPLVNSWKPAVPQISCTLAELGEVSVYPVSSRYTQESKIWFALVDHYHYLKNSHICGAQIRYLVRSDQGYLGALSFSSATWALACRDEYIGWTEAARRAHLERVVCNNRFLILPGVKVPNLASHVLSLALSRLVADWEQRYHTQPVMVETFVDPSFRGTCYKAANFTAVGKSAGRRDGKPKEVFLYPLCQDWQYILRVEPEIKMPRPEKPGSWAEAEFGTLQLYDERLKQRLYTIAQDFYNCPQANIPEACQSKARTMGAYRFFQNPKVTMDIILNAHTEATVERIKQERVVLVPQDTTELDYTTHPLTEGLGPLNTLKHKNIGLLLHDTLAFTLEGVPLGILQAQCWARDPHQRGKRYIRKELPIEQKESMKWLKSFRQVSKIQKLCPNTQLVSIGDREADIYELFLEAIKPGAPRLLVRAEKSRKRKVDHEFLWDYMQRQEIMVSHQIHVPRQGSRKERDSWLDIRFGEVTLNPVKGHTTPITVWLVYAVENPKFTPADTKPLEWMLLTTIEVKSVEDAIEKVDWYKRRWGIEVYHRTLKSGCRIEDRQLEEADRLETCLGVDMVVAWRIYYMTMLAREKPDEPCTSVFKNDEWKALHYMVKKTPNLPAEPPTLRQAIFMIASMGGHLGRKSDGFPGTQTIWRGLAKLDAATEMYTFMVHQFVLHPRHSGP